MFETEQFKKEICSPKGVCCRHFYVKGMGKNQRSFTCILLCVHKASWKNVHVEEEVLLVGLLRAFSQALAHSAELCNHMKLNIQTNCIPLP